MRYLDATMVRFPRTLGFLLLASMTGASVGCAVLDPEGGNGPEDPLPPEVIDCVDHRVEWEPPTEGEYRIEVPTMVIPPGEEILFCYYGTYDGPDAGVVGFRPESPGGFLHHTLIKRVDDDEYPNGHLMDCTAPELQWPPKPVLFEAVAPSLDNWINLPEGIAFKLSEGQRWVTDVHYINVSPDPICMNTAFYLDLIPDSEVSSYAAAFNLDRGGFVLPPGEETTESFDCTWEQDLNILSVAGHMHEHGQSFEVIHHSEGQPSESIYDVADWQPYFQTGAPNIQFDFGELEVAAGDTFETVCTWVNDLDEPLGYPDEMCTAFGVAYPLEDALFCDNGSFGSGPGGGPGPGGDGVVEGVFTRSHPLAGDGLGDLHVFVFASEPGPNAGSPVARATIEDVDLSVDGTSQSYRIEGLPTGGDSLYISGFFDEDRSGYMTGPNPGDLVVQAPSEQLAFNPFASTPVTLNLDLNEIVE